MCEGKTVCLRSQTLHTENICNEHNENYVCVRACTCGFAVLFKATQLLSSVHDIHIVCLISESRTYKCTNDSINRRQDIAEM